MGNRALLVFNTSPQAKEESRPLPALYLQWNGGPESVYAFVAATMNRYAGARPCTDIQAFGARLIETICRFFDSPEGLSAYIAAVKRSDLRAGQRLADIDPGDNGVYYFTGVKIERAKNGRWFSEVEKTIERNEAIATPQYAGIMSTLANPNKVAA